MKTRTYPTITWIIIFLIFITAVFIQSHLLLSWDISWFLSITQKFLAGGNYVTAFMDMNPPISIYAQIPTVLLSNSTGMNIVLTTRILTFTLSIISFLTCTTLINRLFTKKERLLRTALLIAISICFFLLPTYEFGQREHLFLLLTMPYFLQITYFAENKNTPWHLSTWVGLLAGIGFLMNIEYIVLFLVLELYLMLKHKKLSSILRIDSLLILLILAGYIASTLLFTPAYFNIILPLVTFLYYKTFNNTWQVLLLNPVLISWLAVLILFPLHIKSMKHRPLAIILLILTTGCMIQFMLTQKIWYYHMLPTLAFSLLLLILYVTNDLFNLRYSTQVNMNNEWKLLTKTVIVFALLVLLPIKAIFTYTRAALAYSNTPSNEINQLISYTKTHAEGKTIYVFSTAMAPGTTLIDCANITLGSRFPDHWMLPGIIKLSKETLSTKNKEKLKRAKQLLFNIVIKDFQKNKPNYVFVDTAQHKDYFGNTPFNYIQYFSQNSRFKKLWKHYHQVNQIGNFEIYHRS